MPPFREQDPELAKGGYDRAIAGIVAIGERTAHERHFLAEVIELRPKHLDPFSIRIEVGTALVGQRVALAVTRDAAAGVADFLEVGQRGIDHARARSIEAVRSQTQEFDELIPMVRRIGEQGGQQQVQFPGAELAPPRKVVSIRGRTHRKTFSSDTTFNTA